MIPRWACRSLAGVSVAMASIPLAGLVAAPPAGAASISATAYWTKAGAPIPTAVKGGLVVGDDPSAAVDPSNPPAPPVALPVSPPAVPHVPGPQVFGPTAVSALRITGVPQNSDVTLTLGAASGSVPPLPTVSTIVACPIANSGWQVPAGGTGQIGQQPGANCSTSSVGRGGSGNSLSWVLPASFQGTPGELDIELLPGVVAAPAPFLASFDPPTPSDLKFANGAPISALPGVVSSPAADLGPITAPISSSPPVAPVVPTPAPVPQVSSPPPAAATPSLPGVNQLAGVSIPGVSDDRSHRIMAVVLLFAIGVGWWWVGGRTNRGPRRLGALAGEGPTHVENLGGIGRFRRTRGDRPARLS